MKANWLTRRLKPMLTRLVTKKPKSAGPDPAESDRPDWEYLPDGWNRQAIDPAIKGWQAQSILDVYKKNWPTFLANIAGPGLLGISPESASTERDNLTLHNIVMTFGYVLALAARNKPTLSMLDWGGNIGHYYLLARELIPDLSIEYHCKDLPLFADHGRSLLPTQHFHTDDACLERQYDLVMASSSLQYAQDWRAVLGRLARATASYLFITSLPTVGAAHSFVFVQRPYKYGYNTEYVGWCFNRAELVDAARSAGQELVREVIVGHAPIIDGAPEQTQYYGFLFRPTTRARNL
jgi:putative methyltransferase (TIGR04325 family)